MKHSATIVLDRDYWSEGYDQARRYGSRWLLIERIIGGSLIALGVGLFAYTYLRGGTMMLPLVLVGIGTFELFGDHLKKFFWLRRQMTGKLAEAKIELSFGVEGMETSGPFSTGHTTWQGLDRVVRTPKGLLIWPHKGIYFYVPTSVVGQEGIDYIAARVA